MRVRVEGFHLKTHVMHRYLKFRFINLNFRFINLNFRFFSLNSRFFKVSKEVQRGKKAAISNPISTQIKYVRVTLG